MSKWDKMGSENFRTCEAENTPVKVGMVGRVSRTERSDSESFFLWIYQYTTRILIGVSGRHA